ncbi:MAG: nucleotidyltransferase domain-containing protein [Candidatus Omnitrophota bacterium]|nr:nucleotidyltransferase domain-containing protein [Candidatus Omnitrophota bacterium]
MDRQEIIRKIHQNRAILKKYGVRKLQLFGSGARQAMTHQSDLDFIVAFETKTFDAYMGLKHDLESLFECRVDLVLLDTLKPRIRKNIEGDLIDAP